MLQATDKIKICHHSLLSYLFIFRLLFVSRTKFSSPCVTIMVNRIRIFLIHDVFLVQIIQFYTSRHARFNRIIIVDTGIMSG